MTPAGRLLSSGFPRPPTLLSCCLQCRSPASLSPALRLCAGIQLRWSLVEIPEQRRTQPSFDAELRAVIPIATRLLTPPLQLDGVPRKRRGREQQTKPSFLI